MRLAGGKAEKIDLVVTLGGDGTILHASSLFSTGAVPPVLSFSMGTLGFLLPFRELIPCCSMPEPVINITTQILTTLRRRWRAYLWERRLSSTGCD